jgi:hypothetical protein
LAKERISGAIGTLARPRKRQHLAPPISGEAAALEQAGFGESGEQLRHRRPGDAGSARQLSSGNVFACDRAQRQILRHRQGWLVRCE